MCDDAEEGSAVREKLFSHLSSNRAAVSEKKDGLEQARLARPIRAQDSRPLGIKRELRVLDATEVLDVNG